MTLIVANAPYDAVMGETSDQSGIERNAVWRNLVGPGSRAILSDRERADLQARLVSDLRLTAARYPNDRSIPRLVSEISSLSPKFVELWESATVDVPRNSSRAKTIDHPTVGHINLDCDTLIVTADDLRIMVYTAEPGTEDAARLDLAIVLGTQSLVD